MTPTKKTYSLRTIEHPNPYRPQEKRTLYSMLNVVEGFSGNFSNIRHNGINPLETTVKDIKLYHKDNFITIGVDSNNKVAHFFTVDLTTLKLTYKFFEKPSIKKGFKKNNTFLLDKYLFLLACSSEKMKFQIHNFQTNSLIKEYSLTKNDSITIKNGPIIVENGTYSDYRELEKTAKYLRKISFDKLGISAQKVNKKYNIVLGGITKKGGLENINFSNSSLGVNSFSTNYTFSYSNRATYINCLFSEDFEHVKGEIPLNNYDLLKDFEKTLKSPKAVHIVRNKEKLYYGYYNTEDKKYTIFRM
ncbi:hypothetical protein [Aquimarina litoralis]|uniref:hypothetical protein n=1 Tax=Aquimarina litoralis TaxID=584605 RepID=UPI0031DFF8C7